MSKLGEDATQAATELGNLAGATTHAASSQAPTGVGPAPGSMVDRYRVVERLGAGGMGAVYRAVDTRLGRDVALKLRVADGVDSGACSLLCGLLVREAKILSELSHPNVVTVYDVGPYGPCIYLAMELVDGRTLRDWAKEGSVADRRRALRDAGKGLVAAHARGVVHRDFKPENVLIATDGRVCVVDFGLARTDRDLEAEGGIDCGCAESGRAILRELEGPAGTPRYMAPEQHRGDLVDARTDQFAFALTAWELLTDQLPFPEGFGPRWQAMRSGRVIEPPPDRLGPELDAALRTALAFDPANRHESLDALLERLS